jgi:hypothetical protein
MSPSRRTNHVLETHLSLVFIYAVLGNIIMFPIAITLLTALILTIIEALHMFNNVLQHWHENKQQRVEKARTEEITLITARLSKKINEQAKMQMALLKDKLDLAEKRRSEDFANMAELIYNEGAAIQALARKEEEKSRREAEAVNVENEPTIAAKKTSEIKEEERADKGAVVKTARNREVKTQRIGIKSESPKSPRDLLPHWVNDLDPKSSHFTCVGKTLKGQRCKQWMISNECKNNAANRLEKIRSTNSEDVFSPLKLLELANWMLCPRWHQSGKHAQGEKIAHVWYYELQAARDALAACKKVPSTPSLPRFTFTCLVSPSNSYYSSPSSSRQSSSSSIGHFSSNVSTPLSSPDERNLDQVGPKSIIVNPATRSTDGGRAEKGRVFLTSTFEALAENKKNQVRIA